MKADEKQRVRGIDRRLRGQLDRAQGLISKALGEKLSLEQRDRLGEVRVVLSEIRSQLDLMKEVIERTVYVRERHGHARKGALSPTYVCWRGMMQRCYDKRHAGYAYYGGRGISVCREWHDFVRFLSDMGERPPGMSIDRRDNDKGYDKANCRWATRQVQSRNRRNVKNREVPAA